MKKSAKITVGVVSAAVVAGTAAMLLNKPEVKPESEWAVYWYLCGSDLESGHQAASDDISELLSVTLPENTEFVIEAGGTARWDNAKIDENKLTRLTYCGDKLSVEEKTDLKNMGDPETLSDFLLFCLEKHPAKHSMLLVWDHGGGTLGGVSYDANFNMDSLSLPELTEGLEGGIPEGKKLDIIGFDACLMSTLDTVMAVSDYADYMVASQQLEPVCGWNYSYIAKALQDPIALTARDLGVKVCDSFYEGCMTYGLADAATLALTDLGKADQLAAAYEEAVREFFDASLVSDESMAYVRRSADSAENYGVNGKAVGYTDMIDMIEFLCGEGGELSAGMEAALSEAVLYKIYGAASDSSCGISCYYPLDQSLRSVLKYENSSEISDDVGLFFRYIINPEVNGEIDEYAKRRGISSDSILKVRYQVTEDDLNVVLPEDGQSDIVLKVDPQKAAKMAGFKTVVSTMTSLPNTLFAENGKEEMYRLMENGERKCSMEDYSNGEFRFERNIKAAFAGDTELSTYISSVEEEYIKYYAPVVIDGNDGFFLFSVGRNDDSIDFLGAYSAAEHNAGQYVIDDEVETEALNVLPESKEFIGKRLFPLHDGMEIRALYYVTYTDDPGSTEGYHTWEESEPFTVNSGFAFSLKTVTANCVSFVVTDECGRSAISKRTAFDGILPEENVNETETEAETGSTETEAETETESVTETTTAERRTGSLTGIPAAGTTTAAPQESTTAVQPTTAVPETRAAAPENNRRAGGGGSDDEDDEPETTAPTSAPTEAPTTAPTSAPETSPSTEATSESTTAETTAPESTTAETTAPESTTAETTAPESTTAPETCAYDSNEGTGTCSSCGKVICDTHTKVCSTCGKTFCPDHVSACSTCGVLLCSADVRACSECGKAFCKEHVGACAYCTGMIMVCDSCTAAHNEMHECPGCGELLSESAMGKGSHKVCDGCGEVYKCASVEAGFTACQLADCGREYCSSCASPNLGGKLSSCVDCKKEICPDHFVLCPGCENSVCPDCEEKHRCSYSGCSSYLCRTDSFECAACGKRFCYEHHVYCEYCNQDFCPDCYEEHEKTIEPCPYCVTSVEYYCENSKSTHMERNHSEPSSTPPATEPST